MVYILQVPPGLYEEQGKSINRGAIYISETSPLEVSQAYLKQFQEDFYLFLESRSQELIVGGKMVLILLGRAGLDHVDRGNSFLWELLSRSFALLVSKVYIRYPKELVTYCFKIFELLSLSFFGKSLGGG